MPVYEIQDTAPAHVPADLVFPYDIYEPGEGDTDFFRGLCALRAKAPPIFWTPYNGGHWYVTDSKLATQVLSSPDHFSSSRLLIPQRLSEGPRMVPITLDPPEHTKYRMHLSLALSVKSVHELSDSVRTLAIELIEGLAAKGSCEFMGDFAFQLPIIVFMRLVDLPEEDRNPLLEEVKKIIQPGHDKVGTIRKLAEYLHPVVQARYAEPASDLISWLGQRDIDGERISFEALHSMCTLLLIGGLDSVANTLGFFARFLAENPDHRKQLLENPSIIPAAVEELLRRHPTVTAGTGRICMQDTQLGDALIKQGESILAAPAMMNFDPEIYPDPLKVDFNRKIRSVGTFGQGPHRCVGANLARSELTIFLQEWLPRIPDFQLGEDEIQFIPGINISYRNLPLVWPV